MSVLIIKFQAEAEFARDLFRMQVRPQRILLKSPL